MARSRSISICDSLLKIDPFLKRLITGDKKWMVYKTLIANDLGWCKMKQPRRYQKLRFTKERLPKSIWRDYKGILHWLIQTCRFNNSPNWAMQLKKNGQNWKTVRVLFFSKIMQIPTNLWPLAKSYWPWYGQIVALFLVKNHPNKIWQTNFNTTYFLPRMSVLFSFFF